MGETNKRHNRKIWRSCPVCKGRVVLAYRNQNWWVSCEYDASHIPQRFFPHPHEAIEAWNVKGNKQTNADLIRAMTDEELADFCFCITDDVASYYGSAEYKQKYPVAPKAWLDWLREETEE